MTKYTRLLAIHHALSDAVSAYVVATTIVFLKVPVTQMFFVVLLYNFLSFATQFLFGFFCDRFLLSRKYIYLSLGLALISILLIPINYIMCIVIVGIANALFHVAGAHETLKLSKNKATEIGFFIAPGAIGLLLGTLYNSNSYFKLGLIAVIFTFAVLYKVMGQKAQNDYEKINPSVISKPAISAILLLFSVVVIRALLGFSLPYTWKSSLPNATIIFTTVIFIGKIFGGLIADKTSLTKTGILSLIGAVVFLTLGVKFPVAGFLGVLFIQMTTAITLLLIYKQLPNYPGFSFGLTTLAIFIGSIPVLTQNLDYFKTPLMLFTFSGLALVALVGASLKLKPFVGKSNSSNIKI